MDIYNLGKASKCRLKKLGGLTWHVQENPNTPSPTEQRIINALSTTDITFYREVTFNKLLIRKTVYYRFDFWIPKYRLLIEYDGKHHLEPSNKAKDLYKDNFALWNNLKLHRFNIDNYQTLEQDVLTCLYEVKKHSEIKSKYRKP